MVHSREFHAGVLDWEATVVDDDGLETAGASVIGVTAISIMSGPDGVLRRIEAAYLRAKAWPRPRTIVATPRTGIPLRATSDPVAASRSS